MNTSCAYFNRKRTAITERTETPRLRLFRGCFATGASLRSASGTRSACVNGLSPVCAFRYLQQDCSEAGSLDPASTPDLTSLRQGYGGPPELQRRRKVGPPYAVTSVGAEALDRCV